MQILQVLQDAQCWTYPSHCISVANLQPVQRFVLLRAWHTLVLGLGARRYQEYLVVSPTRQHLHYITSNDGILWVGYNHLYQLMDT